jgi:Condensation domain
MRRREIQASAGQRLLWLLGEYHGLQEALNCPLICRISGPVEIPVLQAALQSLIARHESLRTTFIRRDRQLRQIIHESAQIALGCVDLTPAADAEHVAQNALADDLRAPIDPSIWPVRLTLWRIAPQSYTLCMNMHHLVTDTHSCLVLQRELGTAYLECQAGTSHLSPTGWQFSQFMAWQERQITGDGFHRHRAYWLQQIAGASAPRLPLAPTRPRSPIPRKSVHATIAANCIVQLRSFATIHHTTMFTVMLAVYYALLNRATDQEDLAVASVFANRTRREVENTVGFLANMLVLRIRCDGMETFDDLIRRVRSTVREAMIYQDLPYHLVSTGARSLDSPRLDEIVFQMLAEPIDVVVSAGDVEFKGIVPDVIGRFQLELALMPRGDEVAVKLYYAEGMVTSAWARTFIDAYVTVAGQLAAAPNIPLRSSIESLRGIGSP